MDNTCLKVYPYYIPEDLAAKKRYEKLFKQYRYKDPLVASLIQAFGLELDKLETAKEFYFVKPIQMDNLEYITQCLLNELGLEYSNNFLTNAKTMQQLSRSEITKCIRLLHPHSKKYSLFYLVSSMAGYIPANLSQIELLQKIVDCPADKVFSLDLMFYLNSKAPRKYFGILPIIANDQLTYEYVYHLLFGCNAEQFASWLMTKDQYLNIDNGKLIAGNKLANYAVVEKNARLVSGVNEIMPFATKLVLQHCGDTDFLLIKASDKIQESPHERPKRKTIPKAIRNQLWKKYFGHNLKGNCFCCKAEIDALAHWEAGHIKAASEGGSDNIENLRPVCSTCNKSMGNMHMDDYIKRYLK